MTQWYQIRALADRPRAAEISIYGDIGESWFGETVTARQFVQDLAALDADEITIRINSYGGSVTDGIAIYNAIRRKPGQKTVCIDGVAASIASLIAMAGDRVEMADNAMMMIHAPWGIAAGNASELRDMADVLDKYAQAMASSYVAKSGKSHEEIMALLTDGQDHWYSATEAQAEGFADAVTESLPIAASVFRAALTAWFKSLPQPRREPAAAAAQHEEQSMSENQGTGVAADPQKPAVDIEAIRAETLRAEAKRRAEILALKSKPAFAAYADVIEACASDPDITIVQAKERLLEKIAETSAPVAGAHVVTVEDERDKFRAAAANAILARAGVPGVARDEANPMRGYSLMDLARASLARAGIKTDGMDRMQIVAAAFTQSTSDFPVLLENVMHKTLQTAYATAPDTWTRFCSVGTVSDFRDHHRYRIGSFGNLDAVGELEEFKSKSLPDGERSTISVGTKGNLVTISRQMIINDDLQAFVGISTMLGRAARRSIEADVYALLAQNGGLGPTLRDGKPLFDASRKNIAKSGAISVDVLEDARVKMASQTDVSGNDFLDLRPAIWLGPMGLGGEARVINESQYDPSADNKLQKPNKVRGLFRDIVDTPRLSGTRFYLFADPMEAPVLEVAFLDGNQTPYLELQNGFEVDGAVYKVRLDYGVAAIDYRGAVTAPGA